MRSPAQPASWLYRLALIGAFIAAASLFALRLKDAVPADLKARFTSSVETVIPARIEAASQLNLVSENAGRVKSVHVKTGSRVEPGSVIVTLENNELSGQTVVSQKRLEIARLRLAALRPNPNGERIAQAERDLEAARTRLEAFTTREHESTSKAAHERVAAVRKLIKQGLATEAELDNAQARESTAGRDLRAAEEHRSRLQQEFQQAASQLTLVQMQSAGSQSEIAVAESDVEAARNALDLAIQRASSLVVAAPASGTITSLGVREGEWALAGTPLARIADLSRLMITAPANATLARKVVPGSAAAVRLPTTPPTRVDVTIAEVTLIPDAVQSAYLVRALIPNPDAGAALIGLEAALELRHRDR
ncbi:MAG: HlyD family secretion protein [Bryobacteraceae bacterium]